MMSFGIKKETTHYKEFTGGAAQISASTTAYAPINGTTNYNATENNRQTLISRTCLISNLVVVLGNGQPASGNLVFTVRKNGVDTALTITVLANAAAGTYSDTTHSVSFSAGDLISSKGANAATGNSAALVAWAVKTK